MEATEREKPLIKDLNEHIVCPLCRGYLIDATTLVECLHSFCRGCIVRRLSSGARACPACNVSTSPPLLPDPRLQRLVYLVVPGLFRSELERRRHFRLVNPQCPPLAPPLGGLDLTLDDFVSLSLREISEPSEIEIVESRPPSSQESISSAVAIESCQERKQEDEQNRGTRYLKCPAGVTVRHLVRLLMLKRGWEEANAGVNVANRIEMMYEKQDEQRDDDGEMRTLNHSWTLLDLACIFGWKRDAPMKLFYRILRKDDTASTLKTSPYNEEPNKDGSSMENIQRPPTPPPSPNPVQEREVEPRRILESNSKDAPSRVLDADVTDKETKTKKPRCEVTPVMRTTEPIGLAAMQSHHAPESTKELARLEHRKRRKRRNKRVIAEITTTPREDLLKLKVRLTPCPPRITSNNGGGQTKEKLLQMRAVRREKIKAGGISQQRTSTAALAREESGKECTVESEETIEDIIDSIPDEVVRIAQNITTQGEEVSNSAERSTENAQRSVVVASNRGPPPPTKPKEEAKFDVIKTADATNDAERPRKDEEILRRLGLVAINEANESLRDKTKQRSQGSGDKIDALDREKLEKQFRESKANRIRSLLAEKQMRDALKSIMSKTKEESLTTPTMQVNTVQAAPKKKGPPPLAPLRVTKPSSKFQTSNAMHDSHNSKYESPLDLSSAGTVNDNVLDLSATLLSTGSTVASSSSSSSFLTSSSSSVSSSSLSSASSPFSTSSSFSRPPRAAVAPGNFLRKPKELEQRRGQDTNLRTLSDAAVSLLSGCISDKTPVDPLVLGSANVAASKVALRIPQPQRISGFSIKNKPNLGVRHIPNPQAVVASQYRNQRASYFNAVSQQPP